MLLYRTIPIHWVCARDIDDEFLFAAISTTKRAAEETALGRGAWFIEGALHDVVVGIEMKDQCVASGSGESLGGEG